MADENDGVLRDLQAQIKEADIPAGRLSTLAKQGDEKLVQAFLGENIKVKKSGPEAIQSQLYIASFWGIKDIVKQLLANGADPNKQNSGSLWTPLHAATFQEHGPVVMLLLENGADPETEDSEKRTPKDFASASDKIWPHFAALKLNRISKSDLIAKQILQKTDHVQSVKGTSGGIKMAEYNRPLSSSNNNSDSYSLAALQGDVLGDEKEPKPRHPAVQPPFALWQ